MDDNLHYRADPELAVLLRATVVYCAIVLLITGAVVLFLVVQGDDYNSWWVFLLFVFGLALFPGTTVPWWWWTAGRTSYEVGNGRLIVRRGQRVVHDWSCAEIYGLWVRGGASWPELLNTKMEFADGKFPHLVVWTDERTDAPAILRVGHDSGRGLERALILACKSNGSRASLGGS